jgi:hypothetical protein
MLDLTSFIESFRLLELPAKLPLLYEVLQSFLCLSHSSGIRPISRYSGHSERTLFRMIALEIPWTLINLRLFQCFVWQQKEADVYALIGDEVVEGKAGSATYGMRKFYSTTARRAIPAVNFFGFSLVNLRTGKTTPVDLQQVVYTQADETRLATEKAEKKAKKDKDKDKPTSKRGRPKGSSNKVKADPALTKPVYRAFKEGLCAIFAQILALHLNIPLSYMLLDGAYIAAHYIQICKNTSCMSSPNYPSMPPCICLIRAKKVKPNPKNMVKKCNLIP